jgi:hypothetical protein
VKPSVISQAPPGLGDKVSTAPAGLGNQQFVVGPTVDTAAKPMGTAPMPTAAHPQGNGPAPVAEAPSMATPKAPATVQPNGPAPGGADNDVLGGKASVDGAPSQPRFLRG